MIQIGTYEPSHSPDCCWDDMLSTATLCDEDVDKHLSAWHTSLSHAMTLSMFPKNNLSLMNSIPSLLRAHPVIGRAFNQAQPMVIPLDYELSQHQIVSTAAYMNLYFPGPARLADHWHAAICFELAQFEVAFKFNNAKNLTRAQLHKTFFPVQPDADTEDGLFRGWRQAKDQREFRC